MLFWDRPSELGQEGRGAVADNSGILTLWQHPPHPAQYGAGLCFLTFIVCFINPYGHEWAPYELHSRDVCRGLNGGP